MSKTNVKCFCRKVINKLKNRSLLRRYFSAFLVLAFFCFILMGLALGLFGINNWTDQTLELLKENSKNIASLTTEVLTTRMDKDTQGSIFMLCNNITSISKAIDADVFVCNTSGEVILCKDLLSEDYVISSNGECPIHSHYQITDSGMNEVLKGSYSNDRTTLDDSFSENQIVAAEPVYVNSQAVAVVFAVKPVSSGAMTYLMSMIKIFLLAAAFALLVGAIAIYFFTNRIIMPLKEMSEATKSYAKGDFSYRVHERGNGELAELLKAFNAMASNLALVESSRRSFVANVSHELKTPMTTIGGFIDGILDGTIPPEREKYYLEIVSKETKRLSRLVVAMLNMSKIEAGELNLNPQQFNICTDIVNVLISFEQPIEQKNIEICGLDALEPTFVLADQDMIHQVIYNLVDNAVKFTKDGTISVFVEKDETGTTFVKIRNTCLGISSEEMSKIFERFYKVDKSRSYDVKGAGLGLYIVKTIVEMHGGKVCVRSEENEYAEFEFSLPSIPREAEQQ